MAEQKPWPPQPALDHSLLGAALAQVRDADAWWADRSCLIFMALTCVRSGEAREATWDEVDMAAGIWTIPGSRMKSGFSHRVPLSTQAKEVLLHAREQTAPSENRIFPPSRSGRVHSTRNPLHAPEGAGATDGATWIQGQLPKLGRGAAAHHGLRGLDGPGARTIPRP